MESELRLAELVAALSLATELGMGQPMEHALRATVLTVHLGEALGMNEAELSDSYYASLLGMVGCTSDSHEFADLVGATRSPPAAGSTASMWASPCR